MRFLGKRLPPLGTLVAFEAASRNLSFTKAAEELHLTQAAISRQIRLLEQDLGVLLFNRAHRAVTLSPEGRDLQHTVSLALAHIANAAEQVRSTGGEHRLTVAADQSVAALWLMPRLAAFRHAHPDIPVRLVVSDTDADCLADHIDVSLVHGNGVWPDYDAALLFDEDIFPVCSPAYLASNSPVECANDLVHQTLLALEDDHWDWMTWRVWLTENEVNLSTEHHAMTINNYPLVLQAAAAGQGIALGWRHLADSYLDGGSLVAPLGTQSVATGFGYYLLVPRNRPTSVDTTQFRDWLTG
ncbi:MAG: LysR family transcriptional regulator [Rhodospirillales bacterium]|nr:LysR family transcriptional regulator [Rhodospirillales bacterium]